MLCRCREVKMVAARYITLRDESSMSLISSSKSKDAGIFILLSGKANLVTSNKEEPGQKTTKLKVGAVFGPTDLFNAEEDSADMTTTYKCAVTSGSVLQLKYQDLYRAKYGDRSLNADPNEGLTTEEISLRDASTFGESRLSPAMFQFLKKNNLLATSEKDVSYKYIKSGSIGRTIPAKKMEQELIVILDGSLRLIFGHRGANPDASTGTNAHSSGDSSEHSFGEITCTKGGEKSATFKIPQFPLSIIENGALLHLDEKILSSGASIGSAGGGVGGGVDEEVEDAVSLAGAGTGALGMTGGGMEPTGAVMSATTTSPSTQVDYLQHITLQFDKPTTYLSIPLKRLKNALQNETHRVNIDIRQEVNEVVHGLARRLEQLQPLLGGDYIYKEGRRRPRKVETKANASYNGDIASAETSLAGAYGIFSKLECKLETTES
mmetsp:Transcript_20064/g.33806  ORF Transcript_20064/g.33806 Transcript_20064/m.33806 type:complete len:436 (+) Transcript_20064:508-1815(+)